MTSFLDTILDSTARRVDALHGRAGEVMAAATEAPPPVSFADALSGPGLGVIAEVKRRSPSRGEIDGGLDPVAQAMRYAAGGANAVSVLTEPDHFQGSADDLRSVSAAITAPTLRKDFVVDALQVWEARSLGASAVLLIVAALDPPQLVARMADAAEAGLDALVEVHTPDEARIARDSGATIVGVNNRDLSTFVTDLAVAEEIAPLLADVPITIGESGIWDEADAARMSAAGYDAVLVGEALVRADDPAGLVARLRRAG
ncbi:MAG: indole-3-glycerol phosphate synthase TrpC [Acidimicrobiia bacterium]|nr:MAG: indole-3-glycerol phosphate synthase TrpC [Acidimicrobiia bacterium]